MQKEELMGAYLQGNLKAKLINMMDLMVLSYLNSLGQMDTRLLLTIFTILASLYNNRLQNSSKKQLDLVQQL
ncbi:hypothetical protein C7293_15490 [filamentous cyanobacterium CCT1]|nr:hypothetical protein C7293_15490 [filamentous cyanobacterium CCT1]PSN79807.1 hypothetical protein C8B47_09785 [filamentous cyanobacterium CCP4]